MAVPIDLFPKLAYMVKWAGGYWDGNYLCLCSRLVLTKAPSAQLTKKMPMKYSCIAIIRRQDYCTHFPLQFMHSVANVADKRFNYRMRSVNYQFIK